MLAVSSHPSWEIKTGFEFNITFIKTDNSLVGLILYYMSYPLLCSWWKEKKSLEKGINNVNKNKLAATQEKDAFYF